MMIAPEEHAIFPEEDTIDENLLHAFHRLLQTLRSQSWHPKLYRLILLGAISIGSTEGIPFIAPAQEAAMALDPTNQFFYYTFPSAVVMNSACGGIWVWSSMAKDFSSKTLIDKYFKHKINLFSIFIIGFSLVLGAIGGIPTTFASYKYNESIVFPIITAIVELGFKSYGYYRLLDQNFEGFQLYLLKCLKINLLLQQKIRLKQKKVTELGRNLLSRILKESDSHLITLARLFNEGNTHSLDRIILELTTHASERSPTPKSKCTKNDDSLCAILGMLTATSFAFVNGVLSYEATQFVTSNELARLLLLTLGIIPAYVVDNIVIYGMYKQIVYSLRWMAGKEDARDYLMARFPWLTLLLNLLLIPLALFALPSRTFIAYDTLKSHHLISSNFLFGLLIGFVGYTNFLFNYFVANDIAKLLFFNLVLLCTFRKPAMIFFNQLAYVLELLPKIPSDALFSLQREETSLAEEEESPLIEPSQERSCGSFSGVFNLFSNRTSATTTPSNDDTRALMEIRAGYI